MRQMVDQLFGQPVREILLVMLLAHIHEREYSDRFVAAYARCGSLWLFRGTALPEPQSVHGEIDQSQRDQDAYSEYKEHRSAARRSVGGGLLGRTGCGALSVP